MREYKRKTDGFQIIILETLAFYFLNVIQLENKVKKKKRLSAWIFFSIITEKQKALKAKKKK